MLRRAKDRRYDRRRKQELWRTFHKQGGADLFADGFGALESLSELRLAPGATALGQPRGEAEILNYVCEGALAFVDALGRSGVLQAGEFQRISTGRGPPHSETNASRSDWAHVFKLSLKPLQPGSARGHEQKRFSVAERRDGLCLVASQDTQRSSLRVNLNARLYSALLFPGQHVAHELLAGRSAWLHLVKGEVTLDDLVLTAGDGAGISLERAVSFTAREASEILLLDLGPLALPVPQNGSLS